MVGNFFAHNFSAPKAFGRTGVSSYTDYPNYGRELVSTEVAPVVYISKHGSLPDNFDRSWLHRDDAGLSFRQDSAADSRIASGIGPCDSAATGIVFEANAHRS